jgi:WD40 repeat protein
MVRQFDASRLRPRCLSYDSSGQNLAVGFTSGIVKVLDSASLDDAATFKNSKDASVACTFSPLGDFLATADAAHYVYVYKLEMEEVPMDSAEVGALGEIPMDGSVPLVAKSTWSYLGRYKSHSLPVTALEFGLRDGGAQCLVSVAEDRTLVEYDLERSTVGTGVLLREPPKTIEQTAVPTAATWHPLLGVGANRDFEDRIITANTDFKLVQWNADNKGCRRTSLGPTFGGPITRMIPLVPEGKGVPLEEGGDIGGGGAGGSLSAQSVEGMSGGLNPGTAKMLVTKKPFVAYATAEKVVGLAKMPFDGNPAKTMGLIAHPGEVTAIAIAGDAGLLATAGGADQTVNLWSINTAVVDAAEAASLVGSGKEGGQSGPSVAPFVSMLEGGEGGEAHEELIDYFYFAQLRTEGEETTKPRQITGTVPLVEIPNLMRALGYYPSEREVSNMVNEVKYADFTTLGTVKEVITLDEFIALYVNHRPVFGVNKAQIEQAFTVLAKVAAGQGGGSGTAQIGTFGVSGPIDWGPLREQLLSAGESLAEDDLATCLRALTGLDDLPEGDLSSEAFVEQVLGFEDSSVESSACD